MLSFGEMTFSPADGFGVFLPDEWNKTFGEMIQLPDKSDSGTAHFEIAQV